MPKYNINVKGVTVTQDEFEETYHNIDAPSSEDAKTTALNLAYKDGALNVSIVNLEESNPSDNISSSFYRPASMIVIGPFFGYDNDYEYNNYTNFVEDSTELQQNQSDTNEYSPYVTSSLPDNDNYTPYKND